MPPVTWTCIPSLIAGYNVRCMIVENLFYLTESRSIAVAYIMFKVVV